MRVFVCCLILAALAGVVFADVNVTGKWSGSSKLIDAEGQARDSTAVLLLKQNGSEITGSVGPNEDELHALKGKIEGDKITLEANEGGLSIKFDLKLAGDRITGDANVTGEGRSMKATIDVTRAK